VRVASAAGARNPYSSHIAITAALPTRDPRVTCVAHVCMEHVNRIREKFMRSTMFAAALLFAATAAAQAQVASSSQGLFLNLGAGATAHEIEDADADRGLALNAGVGFGFSRSVALFLNVEGAAISNDDQDYNLGQADVGVRYTFMDAASRVRPSVDAGVGMRLMKADDVDFGEYGMVDVQLSGMTLNAGGAVAYHVSPALALDAGLRFSFGKYSKLKVDDVSVDLEGDERIEAQSMRLRVGLAWYPGGGRATHAMRR
jgi:hypothetical protein